MSRTGDGAVKWSEIDKVRFYAIGTGMYSALNVLLHPITVIKTRQQVLNVGAQLRLAGAGAVAGVGGGAGLAVSADGLLHQPTFRSVVRDALRPPTGGAGLRSAALDGVRPLFRGLPVVLSLAVPARALYIGVLEHSREGIGDVMTAALAQAYAGPEEAHALLPLVATVSGGAAGGVAAVAAQVVVVPMDVVSQRQMVMDRETYAREGRAADVFRAVVRSEGWGGLYRGFGLSLLSSLPTGSVWWATYGGCQHWLRSYRDVREGEDRGSAAHLVRRGAVQLASGLSAALVAATLSQPLDVVKTRLQVGAECASGGSGGVGAGAASVHASPMEVARTLWETSGVRGFYRGTGPRIAHMGLWGTVLSSAYEVLRHVSQKDYHLYEDR